MQVNVEERIDTIFTKRKSLLPKIKNLEDEAILIRGHVETLIRSIEKLHTTNSLDNGDQFFIDMLNNFNVTLNSLFLKISKFRTKTNRNTLNIGFGGKMGVGKSYILQKISGLSNDEVPSSKGPAVTAIRSKIINSQERKAIFEFYDEKAFLNEVIKPYYSSIKQSHPETIHEFINGNLTCQQENDEQKINIEWLQKFRSNFQQYHNFLCGEKRQHEISDVRDFVSYTNSNKEETFNYLAVRNLEIYVPFPHSDIKNICLIDLPGLGELNPAVETRHTHGFDDDVDVILYIRNPNSTRPVLDRGDMRALDIFKEACPFEDKKLFILIVHNEGDSTPENAETMYIDCKKQLGDYTIIRSSSRDKEGLTKEILVSILEHLARHLPEMDEDLFSKIEQQFLALKKEINESSKQATNFYTSFGSIADTDEVYDQKTQQTHGQFSSLCERNIINFLGDYGDDEKPEIVDRLDKIKNNIIKYLENGMEHGTLEDWKTYIQNKILTTGHGQYKGAYEDEVNKLRVFISSEFSSLDKTYALLTDKILDIITGAFYVTFPGFLPDEKPDSRSKLQWLLLRINEADYPMDTIQSALAFVLDLKIEHRTQFFPRVYEPIRRLKALGNNFPDLSDDINLASEEFHSHLYNTSVRIVNDIVDGLVIKTKDLKDIYEVSFEYFTDLIARHKYHLRDWKRFIKTFYRDIWPDSNNNNCFLMSTVQKSIKQLYIVTK